MKSELLGWLVILSLCVLAVLVSVILARAMNRVHVTVRHDDDDRRPKTRAPWLAVLAGMAIGAVLFAAGTAMTGEQTRLYGPDGRSVGTATTDSSGSTTTFRDAQGRTIGTTTTTGGTTTLYDARGNVMGRASSQGQPTGR
jgi:YD repeat-containing protein